MSMKKMLEANVAYGRRRISQVFADFCELAALAIRNSVDLHGHDEREARYMGIISGYTAEEANRFAEVLAMLTLEFEEGFSDALGHLYMSLDLGSEHLGQFFTPYDVSTVIAKMTIGDYTETLAGQEFITANEPACGSGGMVIALADELRRAGINYQQRMHVTAQDIELTSVHMAYIQLSLLNVPARVVHGNTLTLEVHDTWHTPAHVLGGWNFKLKNREAIKAVLGLEPEFVAPVTALPARPALPVEAESGDDEAIVTSIRPSAADLEQIG